MCDVCVSCGKPVAPGRMRCEACTPALPDGPAPAPAQPAKGEDSVIRIFKFLVRVFFAIVLFIFIVNGILSCRYSRFQHCNVNLKDIATALEMYSTDHKGHYPQRLDQLVPNSLRSIPTCPSAGVSTYNRGYVSTSKPTDAYTLVCSGYNHSSSVGYGANFPQYTSRGGLIDR